MKKRFYVFFCEADLPWYLKSLKKNFKHCFVLEHQTIGGYDLFLKIEQLTNIVEVTPFMRTLQEILDVVPTTTKYELIKINIDVDRNKPYTPFSLMSCVSLTKKLLGISKPLIITPHQLYKYLLTKEK